MFANRAKINESFDPSLKYHPQLGSLLLLLLEVGSIDICKLKG